MNRTKFLMLAAVALVLLFSPAVALGQPVPPHISQLVVSVDGAAAADGTLVTAWLNGDQAGSAMTTNGVAAMKIEGRASSDGDAINFRIDGKNAAEVDTWEQGGHADKVFAISIGSAPVPPHLSKLLVSVDGAAAADGTLVTAWMNGDQVASGLTSNGVAVIKIPGEASNNGDAISFWIGGRAAAEVDVWEQGGHVDKDFAISTYTVSETPAVYFAELIENQVDGNPNLLGVFWFNAETQTYATYVPDPVFSDLNDLEIVCSGYIPWVRVRAAQELGGKSLVAGWNQFVIP